MDAIDVFQDQEGQWRWHRQAPNGEIISSGEGYIRRSDCLDGVYRANPDNEYELHVDRPV